MIDFNFGNLEEYEADSQSLTSKLFANCLRNELEVLLEGLNRIPNTELDEEHLLAKGLCQGTLKSQLYNNYIRWQK